MTTTVVSSAADLRTGECVRATGAPDSTGNVLAQVNELLAHEYGVDASIGRMRGTTKMAPDAKTAWAWFRAALEEELRKTGLETTAAQIRTGRCRMR